MMGRTVTWTVVVTVTMLISGGSPIALPGFDLSSSIDDPEPFHLPPYLNSVSDDNKGTTPTRLPTTPQPVRPTQSITAGKDGNSVSNYLIKTLTQMDANTLKALSNIINLELNKLTPQEQGQLQGPSQVNSQNQVLGPASNVQYPQLSSGIANGMSTSQQQPSSVMGSSQIKQEGQDYSPNNNLSNQNANLGNGQMGGPVSQPQFNPGQMMVSSMGGGDIGIQGVPNSMFPAAGGSRPSAAANVEVDSSFDPNRLMASIEAETSQYNPNAFLAKQNYITANQWNFANQNKISQNTQYVNRGTNTAEGQHKNPTIMDTSQLNFNPDIMMTALGIKGQKFTFNPDKINSFSSNGFQPGLYPQSAGGQKIPKNMFNADTVNKMLMTYVVVPTEKTKHQPRKHDQISQDIQKTVYNPDTFNHAAVNKVPSTYLQFISNKGRVTVVPSNTQIQNGNPKKQSVVTPSQMRLLKQQTGDHFRAQLEPPISVMDSTPSFENAFKLVTFNPDRINAAQRQFNPDILYRSLILGEDRKALPRKHMPKVARKAVRAENGTDIVVTNKTGEIQTTTTDPNDSGQSTTVPSTVTSTQQPNTTLTTSTTTTTTTTDGILFNPNNINTGIAQMMGFNPGSLMMGYNLPPQGQNTDNGNYAYNPNQMGGFQSVMSPMMSVLMGESGGDSNTVSQTASRPNYDQSQGMSVMFNPADVNQAKMSFDINEQMGFNGNSGNAMFDPMQVNVLASQNVNKSANNSFVGSNGMGMMGNTIFTGVFDPNKVNQVSMTDMQVSKQKNSSASSPVTNYMAAFLGMGGFGGNDQSAFGGSFNPSEVNNAVFDPNDVNNAQMNFDPSNMLDHNPGYDSEKATQTDFDPTKINDIHMNFQPPFVSTDKNKDNNSSSSNAFSRYNLNFTPGQLSPNGNAMVFNPNEINQATMHFSALEIFNSTVPQGNTNFLSQLSGKDSNVVMPDFDPVAVNNMQMNFVPNSPLGAYQSSVTTTGPKPQPSTTSVPTSTTPPTTTSQITSTAAPGTISTPVPTS